MKKTIISMFLLLLSLSAHCMKNEGDNNIAPSKPSKAPPKSEIIRVMDTYEIVYGSAEHEAIEDHRDRRSVGYDLVPEKDNDEEFGKKKYIRSDVFRPIQKIEKKNVENEEQCYCHIM